MSGPSTPSQFLRELHFIEVTSRPHHGKTAKKSQFLRELHFIEVSCAWSGSMRVGGRSSFGNCTSLRCLLGSKVPNPIPNVAVPSGTALH